jgi:hypothetical protein
MLWEIGKERLRGVEQVNTKSIVISRVQELNEVSVYAEAA